MTEKRKFYQKKWFLWLWLIVFPPVGIILLWTVHKTMKGKTKIILSVVSVLWLIMLMADTSGDTSDSPTNIQNDTTQTEQSEDAALEEETSTEETIDSTTEDNTEEQEETSGQKTDAYGWTSDDYTEFIVALNVVAGNYLTQFKIPHYREWQFAKFDDEGRIFAMTRNLTFKNSHEKHAAICVFSLDGEIGENGLHEKVAWNYFATDEKIYYDDGTCDEFFENIMSLSQ